MSHDPGGTSCGQLRHTGAAQDANTEPVLRNLVIKYSENKQQQFAKTCKTTIYNHQATQGMALHDISRSRNNLYINDNDMKLQ